MAFIYLRESVLLLHRQKRESWPFVAAEGKALRLYPLNQAEWRNICIEHNVPPQKTNKRDIMFVSAEVCHFKSQGEGEGCASPRCGQSHVPSVVFPGKALLLFEQCSTPNLASGQDAVLKHQHLGCQP